MKLCNEVPVIMYLGRRHLHLSARRIDYHRMPSCQHFQSFDCPADVVPILKFSNSLARGTMTGPAAHPFSSTLSLLLGKATAPSSNGCRPLLWRIVTGDSAPPILFKIFAVVAGVVLNPLQCTSRSKNSGVHRIRATFGPGFYR